LVDLVVFGGFR